VVPWGDWGYLGDLDAPRWALASPAGPWVELLGLFGLPLGPPWGAFGGPLGVLGGPWAALGRPWGERGGRGGPGGALKTDCCEQAAVLQK
jgi:hypothetical protein